MKDNEKEIIKLIHSITGLKKSKIKFVNINNINNTLIIKFIYKNKEYKINFQDSIK